MKIVHVRVECTGVRGVPPESTRTLGIPENSTVRAVLDAMDLCEHEIMLAFVNGHQATARTQLRDGDLLSLCAFICGG